MAEDATEPNALKKLLALSDRLKSANIHHEVTRYREDGVSIIATVPGERWEIDVLDDGEIVVEIYKSQGGCRGEEALKDLFDRHSDNDND
jgi:hypothetical protein